MVGVAYGGLERAPIRGLRRMVKAANVEVFVDGAVRPVGAEGVRLKVGLGTCLRVDLVVAEVGAEMPGVQTNRVLRVDPHGLR